MLWTVIHAVTGEVLLANADDDAFDRWFDQHTDYRKAIGTEEVDKALREHYARREAREVFVVQE
ncbi:hypothetical protein [Burkholderia cenocepacia]|uniref:hypothetical protein n=1 Tax=Burkholderia cenocepacia TaxID=95486 RepID=UPI001B93AE7C|nr:hypothetical protein [Burkholderia cenocepacia]MBR8428918.1 hypothetical protein [Burkholderia cenocepacia]